MEAAQSHLQDAHVKAREKSDQVKLRVLNADDIVLWKTPGLSKSLSTSWEGPFTVAGSVRLIIKYLGNKAAKLTRR